MPLQVLTQGPAQQRPTKPMPALPCPLAVLAVLTGLAMVLIRLVKPVTLMVPGLLAVLPGASAVARGR